ncbi:MAG: GTPase domain-containing protein [bacterium]|nr:MAG: GTPase domain-containing protein [bacterium]
MAVYNYAGGEINLKVVYYGPGLSGKTTNLEHIYSKLPRDTKSKMVSMKTRTDRTLFFDFLPIDVGEINGMKVRFLLYTVPGQVYYNATRKLVLKGVDAVVFVADSAPDRLPDNIESLQNLEDNLNDLGLSLRSIPWVIQFNKRDLAGCMDRAVMEEKLNTLKVPSSEGVATTGKGVYETFESIARLVFTRVQETLGQERPEPEPAKDSSQEIAVEVVAKGQGSKQNSEAGESESLNYAEKSEEEHESVSEFVDTVLRERDVPDEGIDLGATREGYEEYGHLVELGEGEEKEPEQEIEEGTIISDPLERLGEETATGAQQQVEKPSPAKARRIEEKTVRVPVTISEEEIGKEIPVKVILEVTVESS